MDRGMARRCSMLGRLGDVVQCFQKPDVRGIQVYSLSSDFSVSSLSFFPILSFQSVGYPNGGWPNAQPRPIRGDGLPFLYSASSRSLSEGNEYASALLARIQAQRGGKGAPK